MEQGKIKKASGRRFIIPTIVILFSIIAALLYAALTMEPEPDPASENFIRRSAAGWINTTTLLHKEPNDLNDSDFAKVTKLSIGYYVWDLRLLKKFTNLKELQLTNTRYPKNSVPKWLNILAKYGNYNLEKRFILDLNPIENLYNLEILNLDGSSCKNINPVSNLVNLRYLNLNNTQVTNLNSLKGAINLDTLCIINTSVSNLEPLMELKYLQRLFITKCDNITDKQVEDLQKALPNLIIIR